MAIDIKEIESFEFGSSPELRRRGELSFKRHFKALHHLSPDNLSALDESSLKEGRRCVEDSMESMLNKCESEKRNMTESEEWSYKFGEFMLERYNDAFDKMKGISRSAKQNIINPINSDMFRVHSGGTMRYNPNTEDRSYRGMFHAGDKSIKLDDGEYKRFDNFLMDIASGRITSKLEQRGFAETGGATGGFSVPDEFASWIFDTALESEIVRPRAKVYPMKSATLKIPAWDSSNHTSSLFGGFNSQWTAESATMSDQTAKLRQMELHAHKMTILAKASSEVLQDGLDFEAQIAAAMIKTLSFNLDQAFLTGSGAGQPQGILNSASAVSVTRAGANAIAWADVYGMYSRLHPSCHSSKSCVWVANHSAMPQLMNLQVNNYLVFQPAMFLGIAGAVPASIFSYPILFTEKTPALGTKGDLMLVDLSQYIIGLRSDLSIAKSVDAYFDTDEVGFRIVARVDGQSLWNAPITPVNGTNTLSWCVILE
jgi:HK97 family phage major capsid protein